jgi:hypothetical protein
MKKTKQICPVIEADQKRKSKPRVIRKTITETVSEMSPYEFEGKLSDMQERINSLIAEYGPDATLYWVYNHWLDYSDSPSPRYLLQKDREETEAETDERLREERERANAIKERELKILAELQQKYAQK